MKINKMKINGLMADAEITLKELSELTGISKQTLSTLKTRGTCATKTAGKIAKAFNIPVEEILTL